MGATYLAGQTNKQADISRRKYWKKIKAHNIGIKGHLHKCL